MFVSALQARVHCSVFACWVGHLQQHSHMAQGSPDLSLLYPWHSPAPGARPGKPHNFLLCTVLPGGARCSFVQGEGRHLPSYASGAEGISFVAGFVPQRPLHLLSVSFSGCHAARVQASKNLVRRDKPTASADSSCGKGQCGWLPACPLGTWTVLGWRGRGGALWYTSFPFALGPFYPYPSPLHAAMMMRDVLLCTESVQGLKPAGWEGDGWETVGWCVRSPQAWFSTSVRSWSLAFPPSAAW